MPPVQPSHDSRANRPRVLVADREYAPGAEEIADR
jgi:hypothetical protein